MSFFIRHIIFFCLASSFFSPLLLLSQSEKVSQNQPTVESINIEYVGRQNVGREVILSNIQIREGMPLNRNHLDRSIRSLNDSGLFNQVSVHTDSLESSGVQLTFVVEPKYRIKAVKFTGKGFRERTLRGKIASEKGIILDESIVKNDQNIIIEYYQKKGYYQAKIGYNIILDQDEGTGIIVFDIQKGERFKIQSIQFTGNDSVSARKLRKQMETKRWRLPLSWMTGNGRYNEPFFQEDIGKLQGYYKNLGFLDIMIDEEEVNFETKNGKIYLNIPIKEGRQYFLGEISFEGNSIFTTKDLFDVTKMESGQVFSPRKINIDKGLLDDKYGSLGYLDTRIQPKRQINLAKGIIDLQYTIQEGNKNYVESIEIIGNKKTKSNVIIRELALSPGDVFNTVKMRNSEARLRNTRYFERVELSPQATDIPARKILKIDLEEGRTGNLTFGAGFSSLDNGIVFVEVSQSNFDLFNKKSLFQGDGQKFRLRLQVGASSSEFLLSFEEPWLFEERLALGFELFRTETDYFSSVFDESRTGFEVYLRKRLMGLWAGRLSYRLESVDIFDVDDDEEAPIIIEQKGKTMVSKVGFSMTRDTRNDVLFSTKGNRVRLISELAGIGGDAEYLRLEARGAQFIPLFGETDHVFSVIGRIGTLIDYDGKNDIPFFDRYYLGGPNSLRGFEFREVGPKGQAKDGSYEPIGGSSQGFFSLEYTYKIAEPLRVAVFYDAGFVNSDEIDFNSDDYNDNWGVGLRILVLGSPLRLDFGFPITTDDQNDNDGNQFYFSFGTRF